MKNYEVQMIQEGTVKYYLIRNLETLDIELLPTKYLMHKLKTRLSPNTIRRAAFSLACYMNFLYQNEMEIKGVYELGYQEQRRSICLSEHKGWCIQAGYLPPGNERKQRKESDSRRCIPVPVP